MTTSETIAIGELSRRTRCNIETIRYYERIGLLPKAARRGRYRSFGTADVARLNFVRRARELGFTLDEIRALLGIATADTVSCDDAREIAASLLRRQGIATATFGVAEWNQVRQAVLKAGIDVAEAMQARCAATSSTSRRIGA